MVFYKLKFHSFPQIQFAVASRTTHYKNVISYRKNMIEIGVVSGPVLITENGYTTTRPGKCISVIMPDMNYSTKAMDSSVLYLSSFALSATFDFERYETDNPEEWKKIAQETKQALLLPRYLELDTDYTEFETLIKKICLLYPKEEEGAKMQALSLVFEVLGKLDESFRKNFLGETKESICIYYSKKAKKYIENHYQEKIYIQEIADTLSITPNYLSNIFKQETGQTITEFIALTRLTQARKLLYENDRNPDEIACQVGLSNARNMNRLFFKYFGMSTHKCILADREISLYHEKPWEVEHLTEDIYQQQEE